MRETDKRDELNKDRRMGDGLEEFCCNDKSLTMSNC
jgi:hypothetical protein